jgi:hypothetical protein
LAVNNPPSPEGLIAGSNPAILIYTALHVTQANANAEPITVSVNSEQVAFRLDGRAVLFNTVNLRECHVRQAAFRFDKKTRRTYVRSVVPNCHYRYGNNRFYAKIKTQKEDEMKTVKKYIAALLLIAKIFCGDGRYDRFDKMIANEFYSTIPGFDFIAGLSEYGMNEVNPDPKCDLVHWLLNLPPYDERGVK